MVSVETMVKKAKVGSELFLPRLLTSFLVIVTQFTTSMLVQLHII